MNVKANDLFNVELVEKRLKTSGKLTTDSETILTQINQWKANNEKEIIYSIEMFNYTTDNEIITKAIIFYGEHRCR